MMIGLMLGMAACQSRDNVPTDPKSQDPLNQRQSDQINAWIDGLGRPEQIVRLMANVKPGWGSGDPATATIRAALPSSVCSVKFVSEPDVQNQYRRLLQISGTDCPLQLQYSLEQRFPGQPYFFKGTYLINSDSLAATNGVRGMTIQWSAHTQKQSNSAEYSYRWILSGSGKLITLDNKEIKLTTNVNMQHRTSNQATHNVGAYRFEMSGTEDYFMLEGDYRQSANAPDKSKYRINGTEISRGAFEIYLSKLGFFVGLDSFTDAG